MELVPPSLSDAADLADAGRWSAAREAYAAVLSHEVSGDALHGLARACWWLGEPRSALTHAQRACSVYEEESRLADAARLGVHVSIWYLTNFDNAAAADGWLARSRNLADRSGDELASGWVTLVSGYVASDAEQGRRMIESAATVAASLGDPDLSVMAMADLGLSHVTTGDVEPGMGMLDEALAAAFAEPRRMPEVTVWSACNMLAACTLVDDVRRATQWCREADRFSETYGCPFLQARCRAHYGSVLVANGRWDAAEQEIAEALSMAADTGCGPRTEAVAALAELRRCQGDADAALTLLDDSDATAPASMNGLLSRARCLLDLDRPGEAGAVLRGELAVMGSDDPNRPAFVAVLTEAELTAGRLDAAEELVVPQASVWSAPAFPRAAGRLARAAGLVAAARCDQQRARSQLGFALDVFARLELVFESACTELDLARLLMADDPAAAAARARAAYMQHEALGARREAAKAAAFLRAIGVTPPPGPRRGETLTGREHEVLALLSHGLSNPQIAERLFISRRTVGHHVSSILRKLGLRSRAEAAAYAARGRSHD